MNKRVAAKLVTALRSGKYEQDTGQLHVAGNRYCVMGVLCDLHRRETGDGEWKLFDMGYGYMNHTVFPPRKVKDWAELTDGSALLLIEANDKGQSFAAIADMIVKMIDEDSI